jgi:nondiscriminating aspartyl-tRNA synthetase
MSNRTLISAVAGLVGQEVTLKGFVRTVRDQKRIQFLVMYDHTGAIQVVHMKEDSPALAATISSLTDESAVVVSGKLVENSNVKLGGVELQLRSIEVCNLAQSPLPIQSDSSLDLRIDNRHLSLRSATDQLVIRVQTTMERAMRDFWERAGFAEIHSPKLMGVASESGAELFSLKYFGDKTAYLAQSPQFYKQMAIAGGLDRVFEVGPVFRANPSFTSRHDTEFTSVDMELAWTESHEDVMRFEEEWLASVIAAVKAKHGDEILELFGVEVVVPQTPVPRISLADARAILEARGHVIDHKADLDPEGERMLSTYIAETFGHEFVFVTDYPVEVRAFYHMRHPDNPQLTMSYDLLWKGLEITTGAQREHRVDRLMAQATDRGFDLLPLEHYFKFFEHGCPPHGGCGVGLTRLLMIMLQRSNVREVTFLYRGPNRLTP